MTDRKLQFTRAEEAFQRYFENGKRAIDKELGDLMTRITNPELRTEVADFLRLQVSYLPSTLLMLSAQSVGARKKSLVKLALSVELLYASSRAHDDSLNYGLSRGKMLNARSKRFVDNAILAGDALAALCISLAAEFSGEMIEMFSTASLMLSNGKCNDMEHCERLISEAEYFGRITDESVLLFKTAAKCGAMMGDASDVEADGLAKFGENFGMACQIRNDISKVLSFCNGVPIDFDFLRSSLPAIHLYASSNVSNKQALFDGLTSIDERSAIAVHVNQVCQALQNSASLHYCHGRIGEFVSQGVACLEPLRDSVYKRHLILVAQSLCSENSNNKP